MDFYPVWPVVAGLAVLLLLAGLPWFATADKPPGRSPASARVRTIDGLRGFLALGVMFHHGAIYHRYLRGGIWASPPSRLYDLLGGGGVALFFMITGYLFWGRLLDEGGRPDWARLFIGRLFRIAPVYLLAIAGMLVLVMMRSDWQLRVPPAAFARQVAPWLGLGLLKFTDVNGQVPTYTLLAGVTWSLHYEWLFYLLLPVMAVAAGPGRVRGMVRLLAVAVAIPWILGLGPGDGRDRRCAALFLAGMVCAALDRRGWKPRVGDRWQSAGIVLLLLAVFRFCDGSMAPLAAVLLGCCFFLVASGCTLFGLLSLRVARRLGDISYGIYLLQGLVLAWLFGHSSVRAFALSSPGRHWAVVLLAAVILVGLTAAVHRWIERPGIALGRRVARLVPARSSRVRTLAADADATLGPAPSR